MDEFLTQTDLGKLFGVSSHAVGRWLVEIGLRTKEKKPSKKAFDGGFVTQAPTGRNDGSCWVWNRQKTLEALEAAGHPCRGHQEPSPQARLVGPFEARQSSLNGFEIVSGDGTVSLWGYGQHKVEKVVALLNLGYRHGLFGGESK